MHSLVPVPTCQTPALHLLPPVDLILARGDGAVETARMDNDDLRSLLPETKGRDRETLHILTPKREVLVCE